MQNSVKSPSELCGLGGKWSERRHHFYSLRTGHLEHNTHVAPIMVMGNIAKTDFR